MPFLNRTRALLMLVSVAMFWVAPPVSAAERIGVNAAVKGDVFVRGANEENQRRAVVKEDVSLGDEVDSRKESALQILLLDETVFTVGADCVLTIDEFVYDPSAKKGKMAASVAKGTFRFVTGRIGANSPKDVTITTPTATIGVRGTIIESTVGALAIEIAKLAGLIGPNDKVDPEKATIIVLRGPGPNKNTLDKDGNVDINAGGDSVTLTTSATAVFIPFPGAEPSDPFVFTAEMDALIGRWLRSQPDQTVQNLFDQNEDEEEDNSGSTLSGQDTASGGDGSGTGSGNGNENNNDPDQTGGTPPAGSGPPIHTGIFNNIGDEISTFELAATAAAPVTFYDRDVPLYEDTAGLPAFDANSSINVVTGPFTAGDPQRGSYDFQVTVDPNARSYESSFDITSDLIVGQGSQTVTGKFGVGTAYIDPAWEAAAGLPGTSIQETGACAAGICDTHVDLLVSGSNPLGGVSHSLSVTLDVGEQDVTIRGAGSTYDTTPPVN